MDVLSAVTTVAAVLEQCIELFERIRTAAKDQRALPELITKHEAVILRCQSVIELIQDEKALRTPHIEDCITRLDAISKALHRYLKRREVMRHPIFGFIRQLALGREDKEKLEAIMKELGAIYNELMLYIQISNFGLTRGINDSIRANVVAIETTSQLIRERLGPEVPLRIERLIEGRPQNDDGTVTLTEDDISRLSVDILPPERTTQNTSRIVRNNTATLEALQVNSPVGTDLWKDVDLIRIEGNTASKGSIQWNHPIDSAETFLATVRLLAGQRREALAGV